MANELIGVGMGFGKADPKVVRNRSEQSSLHESIVKVDHTDEAEELVRQLDTARRSDPSGFNALKDVTIHHLSASPEEHLRALSRRLEWARACG